MTKSSKNLDKFPIYFWDNLNIHNISILNVSVPTKIKYIAFNYYRNTYFAITGNNSIKY